MGPIVYPETSVSNYHYTLHNISEERRFLPRRWGSLKSATELVTAVIIITCIMQRT